LCPAPITTPSYSNTFGILYIFIERLERLYEFHWTGWNQWNNWNHVAFKPFT